MILIFYQFGPLEVSFHFLDPELGVVAIGVDVTRLDAIVIGAVTLT